MNEGEFTFLREFLHQRSGLSLTVEKRYLVDSRLASVCRINALPNMSVLVQKIRAGDQALAVAVIEAMTTNETLFFRDTTPFKHFRELILPAMLKARAAERSLRIWCAAASSGQEPYSLAMMLDEMGHELSGWRIEITATDISNDILAKARAGVYSQFEVQRGLPIQSLLKHFTQDGDRWHLNERLKRMVTFKQHNLVRPEGHMGTYDVIFCRNVLIYFDVPTKSKVLGFLARHLRQDGFLLLGAAETVIGVTDAYSVDRDHRGVYRPVGAVQPVLQPVSGRADIRPTDVRPTESGPAMHRPAFPDRPAAAPALSLVGSDSLTRKQLRV